MLLPEQNSSNFPYFNPARDYIGNISNPFYVEKRTELNLFSTAADTSISEFLFLLAEWFVIFGCIMEINVLVYKLSQHHNILPLFQRKDHEEFNEFLAGKEQ